MTGMSYLITILGGAITALFGFLGVRFTQKQAAQATSALDAAEWERRYRSNAERHLKWDLMIMQRVAQLEARAGVDTVPMDEPPPLFPEVPSD